MQVQQTFDDIGISNPGFCQDPRHVPALLTVAPPPTDIIVALPFITMLMTGSYACSPGFGYNQFLRGKYAGRS